MGSPNSPQNSWPNSWLSLWLEELNRRKNLLQLGSIRIAHRNPSPLRCDKLGDVLSGLWYSAEPPEDLDLADFATLAKESGCTHWFLRSAVDRGSDPNTRVTWNSPSCPETWIIEEHGIKYWLKRAEGTSPGIFLDQRERRLWVEENAHGLEVLNLFSYTSGFNLAAVRGGTKKSVSVDLSKKYIAWSKENFKLNNFNVEESEFWSVDAFPFLEGAIRRGRKFDLIICDPPSFSRSDRGVFRIEKNHPELIKLCLKSLNANGRLIFSTNYEGWTLEEFESKVKELTSNFKLLPPPPDFEMPDEEPILKTALIF